MSKSRVIQQKPQETNSVALKGRSKALTHEPSRHQEEEREKISDNLLSGLGIECFEGRIVVIDGNMRNFTRISA